MKLAVALVAFLMFTGPAEASEPDFPVYSGDEFNDLFTHARLDGLDDIGPSPAITNSTATDRRIRTIAERRGYLRRPVARGPLVSADGHLVQAPAAAAWRGLQAEARRAGHSISIISAFRGISTQRTVFLRRSNSFSDNAIDARLRWAAPPGYSKHHTGYAIDIARGGGSAFGFGSTAAFRWLAADNNANAKRFGFIPSYPPDASRQGPDPEPWEWTYVGVDAIRCGGFNLGFASGFLAANQTGSLSDLTVCPDYPLTRGATAHYLASVLGLPAADHQFSDVDGLVYSDSVARIAAAGITRGCNPPDNDRFCPTSHLTRAEMAALLVRAFELPAVGADGTFGDVDGSPFEDAIERVAAAGITRGCNPPDNDRFCPDFLVSRRHLHLFLMRALGNRAPPAGETGHHGTFGDDDGSPFEGDIEWLAAQGLTGGCNPPSNDRFCPEDPVTRGQMAAFLNRALVLPKHPETTSFTDLAESPFASDVGAVASAGIGRGCNPPSNDRFCPLAPVTRGQMAAFLARGLGLPVVPTSFNDTGGHVFEHDIAALAGAEITRGCNPPDNDRFCPDQPVTRAELAAFLRRAFEG
ncbi:hypothetical protein BH23ACT5_BH23ACT5_11180 [soil metagenome]